MIGVLFDLDQTLIDSSIAESHRTSRNWPKVYSLIPKMAPYDGIGGILEFLIERDVQVGIVTSSPRSYCTKVVSHHEFKIDKFVCFHDTTKRKPFPDPILKGIELLEVPAGDVWCIGDDVKDIQASHAAGAHSIAVTWGSVDKKALLASGAEQTFDSVEDLHEFLEKLTRP